MSLLVVDVGTSGVRAAIVTPDAAVTHVQYRQVLPTIAGPGLRGVRRRRDGDRGPRRGPAGAGGRRPGRGGRHRQPALVDGRVGPRHRRPHRPGHRVAGPAHRRHVPGPAGPGDPRLPRRLRHQARGAARHLRQRSGARPLLRHHRLLGGLDPLGRRRPRHRHVQRRRHRPRRPRRRGLVGPAPGGAQHPQPDDADDRRLVGRGGRGVGAAGLAAHRRDGGRPAGVAHRPGLHPSRAWPR